MDHIESNRDVFEPYMEDDESFDDYLGRMRGEAEWGGHQELVAASQLYKVRVVEAASQRRLKWVTSFKIRTIWRVWFSSIWLLSAPYPLPGVANSNRNPWLRLLRCLRAPPTYASIFCVSEQANVVVHQFKAPRFFIPFEKARLTLHLSYHGEHHYNSVRAIGDEGPGPARPITLQTPTSRNGPSVKGETDYCCHCSNARLGECTRDVAGI